MFSAQLGSPSSYYGNINLGLAQVPLYVWGAWEVIGHYQPPLTEKEEKVIEVRQGKAPEPPIDHSETIRRLQHEARLTEITHAPITKKIRQMKKHDDDDETLFIIM